MDSTIFQKEKSILLKKIKILSLILSLAFAIIVAFTVYFLKEQGLLKINVKSPSSNPPYAAEVNKVINPLLYSGVPMFADKDVYLTLDFDKKIWTLHNMHMFNDKDELILRGDKYGTCGELAAYTATKIRPIFENDYNIVFVRASQSGYFLSPRASHVVLRITKKINNQEIYILDPSFHKYGPMDEFEDYLFFEDNAKLDFVENKMADINQPFNVLIPLIIRKDYLVGFTVENKNSKLYQKYFVLGLTLTKKYNYAGRYLFALRYADGDTEIFENKTLAREILNEQEWSILKQKIIELFDKEVNLIHP